MRLRDPAIAPGFGLRFAFRTSRAWWYSAWLRSLARFSRTKLGSFWLGLSNVLSVCILGAIYSTILRVPDPITYITYLGIGLTVWTFISISFVSGTMLFTARRDQLINNCFPALFYLLEEWAFQIQTFLQAFLFVLIALTPFSPLILFHALTSIWLPVLNLFLFLLWSMIIMALLGSRLRDIGQLMPILLQLIFLVSPVLYPRDQLGALSVIADYNPFYFFLAPVREAVITGSVNLFNQILTLFLNAVLVVLGFRLLRSLRHRIPLWV